VIRDQTDGRSVRLEGSRQDTRGALGGWAPDRDGGHQLAGEVIDGHEDMNGPESPELHGRQVGAPDLVGPSGDEEAGQSPLWRGWRSRRPWFSWFRPAKDVSHGRCGDEHSEQRQLLGDPQFPEEGIDLRYLPDKRNDIRRGLVLRNPLRSLRSLDVVNPPIERGMGDTEVLLDAPLGNLEELHVPEDEKSFFDGQMAAFGSGVELTPEDCHP